MEKDFKKFDKQADGVIDYTELTQGVPPVNKDVRLSVLSQLKATFEIVDQDCSHTLDFFEYMFLAFMLTDKGSYQFLVDSEDSAVVKKAMLELKKLYQ